jgi:hypothetical protein
MKREHANLVLSFAHAELLCLAYLVTHIVVPIIPRCAYRYDDLLRSLNINTM